MKMPDLATTDSAIKVIRWLVTPGQPIKRGQALLEVETDKATMEVECIATGVFKEPRAKAVDPSGSGDAFSAGVITAIRRGWDMPRMLSYASALGASATRAVGTTDGVFTATEAEAFVAAHSLVVTPGNL